MKNNMKKIFCGLFAIMLMISCMVVPASASAYDKTGSITVNYADEGTKIKDDKYIQERVLIDGAEFSAALVAKEGNGRFEWVDRITKDPHFVHDTEEMFKQDKIEEISKELVLRFADELSIFTKTTDKTGKCVFTGLEEGIYLVWESDKEGTAAKYDYSVPFLVEIPNREKDPWNFDVEVFPKGSKLIVKMVTITGTKSWKGNDIVGKPDKDDSTKTTEITGTTEEEEKVYRPESITLRLYADGEEVAKTTTNAEKKWAFSFDQVNALNKDGEEVHFTIKEDKVKGYTFTQSAPKVGENTIVINVTNTVGEPAAKTGDESNIVMWLGIIGGAAVLVGVVMLIPSKKKEDKEEKKSIAEKKVEETENQE